MYRKSMLNGHGLGQTEAQQFEQYYFSLKDRALEIASTTMNIADQWSVLQALKNNTINSMIREFGKAVPSAPGGVFALLGWIAEIGTIYSRNFAPALADISRMFDEPEARLKEAGAVVARLNDNLLTLAAPTGALSQVAAEIKTGDYIDPLAQQIIQRAGAVATGALKGHQWASKALAESVAYVSKVAPALRQYMASAEGAAFGKTQLNSMVDRDAIMKALGAGADAAEVDAALRSVGLSNPFPFIIVALVIIALAATGTAAYVYGWHKGAREAADLAKTRIDRLVALFASEMEALKIRAKQAVDAVARETDTTKRTALAEREKSAIDQQASESAGRVQDEAKDAKNEIDKKAGGGPSFDFSSFLMPLGIAAGGLLVLKSLKVI